MSEYKNNHITLNVENKPGCQVTFDIKVSPLAAQAAWEKAIKQVKKQVSLPGFRKGKAPDKVIVDHYEKNVQQDWHQLLVQTAFQEALSLSNIYPLYQDTVKRPELKKPTRENGAEIRIEFESYPVIPDVDTSKLTIQPVEKEEITEKQIEEIIEKVIMHHATWEKEESRPIADGDYVELSVESLAKPGVHIADHTRYFIKEGVTAPWIYSLVIEKQPGDSVEGETPLEETTSIGCKIIIHSIETPKLPGMDDEFFKKIGVKDLEELKQKITQDLENQHTEAQKEKLRIQIENELLEKFPIDVPQSLVDYDKAHRLKELSQQYNAIGIAPETQKEILEKKGKQLADDSLKAYRIFFITQKLGQQHNIQLTEGEILKETFHRLAAGKLAIDQNMEEAQKHVKAILFQRKTLDHIVNQLLK